MPRSLTMPRTPSDARSASSHGGEEDLRRYARYGDSDALERVVSQFQPLARSLAARYQNRAEPFEDLLQVANLGLIKAAQGFDPDKGSRFTSYAVPTILGELRRHFRDRVWSVRLPRRLQESWMELTSTESDLTSRLGRKPSNDELRDELGWTEAEMAETVNAERARLVSSLDQPVGNDEEAADGHSIVGNADRNYEAVDAQIAAESADLSSREKDVLRMQFEEGLSQREIGARIGVSQMQVSRISRKALKRLLAVLGGGGGRSDRFATGSA